MSNDQRYDYLVIPRVQVSHANAIAAYWLVSPVVLMPARQMMHALSRKLDLVEYEAGISVVHHDYALEADHMGGVTTAAQFVGAYGITPTDYIGAKSLKMPLQPTVKQSLTVTLILRFQEGAPIDMDEVTSFLAHGRLAGGTITHFYPPMVCHSESEVRRLVKTGFYQFERADKLYSPDPSGLKTLLETMGLEIAKAEDGSSDSWVMPAVLGYQSLGAVAKREGARDDYPTVYVEPLVGYIKMRSANGLSSDTRLPYWDYKQHDKVFSIIQS